MDPKAVAKLKEQARTHEQREEWDQAISLYVQVLRGADEEEQVGELPLYNRVGDLYLRTGRGNEAVKFYEQAADHYASAGLFNNAIALCNKALRYAPHRVDLLRKLGRFSASQGFLTDARRWFLEYAERAFHKGEVDDAFAALDDFADISDDPEIRELLARKLYAHGRMQDALTEYRRAFSMRLRDGASAEAESLKKEILQRYPELHDVAPIDAHRHTHGPTAEALPEIGEQAPAPPAGLPGLDDKPAAIAGFERTSLSEGESAETAEPLPSLEERPAGAPRGGTAPPSGLERTALAEAEAGTPVAPLPGLDEADQGISPEELAAMASPRSSRGAPPRTTDAPESEPVADYVDLSDLLGVGQEEEKVTRFFVQETDPTGDEDRDFAELLAQFKQKISENVAHDDIGSHYDLGLAFKEMGLLDEAISEFQIALRSGADRLKIFEELGQCFLLKRQFNIAVKVLSRALQFEPDDEIELIGVYYHLGRAYEELAQREKALDAYERVVGLDINFKDVADRMARL
jgi:tetratricopeptide (TPR) repeat protein